ncbi:GntR family transcriptional regulator [Anaerobacillus alkaliphilus]|uniref:GntR family transcriptional regulator n=1 Tax=Anaerobacillus alkaliphilus TaxID=1548597 RepID=A0A4Q0VMU4_9BACI|nr:GntR family transcriptional regulator [Anaerobacillus alkaliphilus]RXI96628.1 GntR family transcriptional regulator [Anaerobacillus alkaliphilus]
MKERSSDLIEKALISSILTGEYKPGESMLSERDLATSFSVGRPTIREVLQRLERDGWITIRKNSPAIVNEYWKQGNLMTIVNILKASPEIPDQFIEYVLELRISLTPTYTKDAITQHPVKVIALFTNLDELEDDASSFASFDWHLQQGLAKLSSNPIYLLILNSFKDVYLRLGEKYFQEASHREASRKFYDDFLQALFEKDVEGTERLSLEMMKRSLELWKTKKSRSDQYEE